MSFILRTLDMNNKNVRRRLDDDRFSLILFLPYRTVQTVYPAYGIDISD